MYRVDENEESRRENATLGLKSSDSTCGQMPQRAESEILTPSWNMASLRIPAASLSAISELVEAMDPPSLTERPVQKKISSSDMTSSARNFSDLSAPGRIVDTALNHIADWKYLTPQDILVDQILSGLSNQLFRVYVREDFENKHLLKYTQFLFRIYGKDVHTLYDTKTELLVFIKLSERGVAPKLMAEFEGGRIEEWIEGSALLCADMGQPTVVMGASEILAGIHKMDLSRFIDKVPCIDKFLSLWREGAMKIFRETSESHPNYLQIQRLRLPELYEESLKLKNFLFPEGIQENELTTLSFCHNDVQENNILITADSMRFIDFEYSGYNYPAYDIAAYFWEATCDYCVNAYPFFHIDESKYPTLEKRKLFIACYLTKKTNRLVKTGYHELINPAIDAVERFQLACHMLWGFWSVIRTSQAATSNSFDMLYYGEKRISAYWSQKAKLLAEGKI